MIPLTILVSTASSIIFPGIADLLRQNKLFNIRVIGMDADEKGGKAGWCDAFYQVPMGSEQEQYIAAVLEICDREEVDLILPISDEECLALSKYMETFVSRNVQVMVNDFKTTALALQKDRALHFLEQKGIDVPSWMRPNSIEKTAAGLEMLGYPDEQVVVKPITARGSRGFWIINEQFDKLQYLKGRERIYLTKSWLMEILEEAAEFPELILMEYLPGESYSIDILAEDGSMLACMPHKRLGHRWGRLDHAKISPKRTLTEMCAEIVKAFQFDNLVNIELGISKEGNSLLIEINPRASATLALNAYTGIDLMHYAIAMKMGEEIELPLEQPNNVEYAIFDRNVRLAETENYYDE